MIGVPTLVDLLGGVGPSTSQAQPTPVVGEPLFNLAVFALFVIVALVVVVRVSRTTSSTSDYYTAGRGFTGAENGLALSGDFLSAATFLGIVGAVAVAGPDGFVYAVLAFVAWLVALFFVAELLRNTGRYTMADALGFRLRQRPVRAAAATSALVISTLYLLAQLAGAGGLVALLLNITSGTGQAAVIVAVGALMVTYVLLGGMTGTTWIQIAKACLLLVAGAAISAFVLGRYGLSVPRLLSAAVANHPKGEAVLRPGLLYGGGLLADLDLFSLALGGVLGVAGLPHILMRFYTVPTARQARRSVVWAIWLIGTFFLLVLVLGYGATALVGPGRILAAPGGVNSAAPLLAYEIGGTVLLAVVAAVAFATILAVVAGLTITAAAAFAHDVYANLLRRGRASAADEIRVARRTTVVIGVVGTAGGILANGQNIAFLVALTFAAAASANLPTLLYALFWRRFTTTGALWSMYGGLATAIGLIVLSPAVSGRPTSMLPDLDFAIFPLSNPGLVSIPVGFLLGYLGTIIGSEAPNTAAYAQMSVRALTGAGVEKPIPGDPSTPPPVGRHRQPLLRPSPVRRRTHTTPPVAGAPSTPSSPATEPLQATVETQPIRPRPAALTLGRVQPLPQRTRGSRPDPAGRPPGG